MECLKPVDSAAANEGEENEEGRQEISPEDIFMDEEAKACAEERQDEAQMMRGEQWMSTQETSESEPRKSPVTDFYVEKALLVTVFLVACCVILLYKFF